MDNYNKEKTERLYEKLRRECGSVILSALENPDVVEVMLNADGSLWLDDIHQGMFDTDHRLSSVNAFNLIGTVADLRGKVINEHHEVLETEFPLDGSRFEATIPEVSVAPCFSLRKKAIRVYSLEDYITQGMLTSVQKHCLQQAILAKQSILIVGGPGTGKTTFANALLNEMVELGNPNQRFVIIEDTRELQCNAPNTLYLKTTPKVDFQPLLRVALRSRPDKICMGECRGAEMLTLLKAWNTGTPGGLATLHANSAESALTRVSEMIQEAGSHPLPRLIKEAINIIVSIQFDKTHGRLVKDILVMDELKDDKLQLKSVIPRQDSICQVTDAASTPVMN